MAEINHCGQCQRFRAFRCAVTGHAIQNGYAMAQHAKHCAHKTKTDAEIVPDAPGRNRDSTAVHHTPTGGTWKRLIATPSAEAKCCRVLGVAVVLLYGVVIAVILGAVTGCISTTIRNDGSGTVNVFVEKRISTDASIPASIIP